jgi:hypothetical protein
MIDVVGAAATIAELVRAERGTNARFEATRKQ